MKSLLKNALKNSSQEKELIEQFISNSRESGLIAMNEAQVNMMSQNWGPDLNDIPLSMRENVALLCRPKDFKVHQKVINFDDKE